MTPIARLACVAILAVAGTAVAEHHEDEAAAPAQAWDQEAAATLAGELAEAVKDLRGAVRDAPPPSAGSMQARQYYQFEDDLRLLASESRRLAEALGKGDGLEQTLPSYRRLRLIVRDARELARSLYIQQSIQDRIDAGRAKLDALAAYYPPEK